MEPPCWIQYPRYFRGARRLIRELGFSTRQFDRAHRLILLAAATDIVDDASTIVDVPARRTESQVRPLAALGPPECRAVARKRS